MYVLIRNYVMLSPNIGTGVLRVDKTHNPQIFQMKFSSLSVRDLTPIFLAFVQTITQANGRRSISNSQFRDVTC